MKTIMKNLITIKSIPVLALVLLAVLGSSFVKGTAQDPEPGLVYSADDTVTDSIVKKLEGTITLYLTEENVDVDADAIYKEMCDLYTLAVETGDVDLYVANYTDDGVQIPPDAPSRFGSEQIRAAIEPALTQFDVVCPIYPGEAKVIGNWAFGHCDWSLSLTPKEGGETTTFDGKGLDVLKRQADGSWKYYISCWNYNGPPAVE
ncbi:MAG: YybH family protein [Planctomycetota bacterium]|jgi:ketosteroid isomerase-like protein